MMQKRPITRKDFIRKSGTLTAAALLSHVMVNGSGCTPQGKKIRIGLIGCGSVSTQYLPHLSKCPYAEVVSTCDIIFDRAKKQTENFSIPDCYPHIDQTLAGAPFDLLVNFTDMQ